MNPVFIKEDITLAADETFEWHGKGFLKSCTKHTVNVSSGEVTLTATHGSGTPNPVNDDNGSPVVIDGLQNFDIGGAAEITVTAGSAGAVLSIASYQ